jgi:hypothetical protein
MNSDKLKGRASYPFETIGVAIAFSPRLEPLLCESKILAEVFGARGAMEIILGTLALNAGLISKPIFVALIVMALVTSLTSGPLIRKFVELDK